jgi:hypothetical protein
MLPQLANPPPHERAPALLAATAYAGGILLAGRLASADVVGGGVPRLRRRGTCVPPEALDNSHSRGVVRHRGTRLPCRRRAQCRILRFHSRPADRALSRRIGGDDHRARGSRRGGARARRRPAADRGGRNRGGCAGARDTCGYACATRSRSCRNAPDHLFAGRKPRRQRARDLDSPWRR